MLLRNHLSIFFYCFLDFPCWLGMVVHTCDPSTNRQKQEDPKCEARLSYTERLSLARPPLEEKVSVYLPLSLSRVTMIGLCMVLSRVTMIGLCMLLSPRSIWNLLSFLNQWLISLFWTFQFCLVLCPFFWDLTHTWDLSVHPTYLYHIFYHSFFFLGLTWGSFYWSIFHIINLVFC